MVWLSKLIDLNSLQYVCQWTRQTCVHFERVFKSHNRAEILSAASNLRKALQISILSWCPAVLTDLVVLTFLFVLYLFLLAAFEGLVVSVVLFEVVTSVLAFTTFSASTISSCVLGSVKCIVISAPVDSVNCVFLVWESTCDGFDLVNSTDSFTVMLLVEVSASLEVAWSRTRQFGEDFNFTFLQQCRGIGTSLYSFIQSQLSSIGQI